ncbi:MAG TPA: pre-peptidase C-terminal domain-containing protein [Myxococcota bacterium]|jgi:cysteine-rich repeat protein|nr:pre-peptidase C-terminal domain-containing protein [Myxococcota bacterium]
MARIRSRGLWPTGALLLAAGAGGAATAGCGCHVDCGDRVLNGRETCDDGNRADGDGCDSRCRVESGASFCGNGIVEPTEECDSGDANDDTLPDACRTNCTSPFCGDNIIDSDEQCEPPFSAGCGDTCQLQTCGNGVVEGSEPCDDGPDNSDLVPDACRTDCSEARCGDGVVDTGHGEECEPATDPGCTFNCTISVKSNHGTCAMPQPVAPDGSVAIAAVASGEASTTEGSCRFVATPPMPAYGEAVFQLDLPETADLTVSTDNPGTDMDTYLYVRGADCTSGPELACNDDIMLGGAVPNLFSEVTLAAMPPGTYFIIVDGSYDDLMNLRAFGPIALTVNAVFVRAAGEACDPAGLSDRCSYGLDCVDDGTPACEDLATPVCAAGGAGALLPGAAPAAGSTVPGAASSFASACDLAGTTAAPEQAWLVTLPAATGVVDVLADVTTTGHEPVVSVRTTCDDATSEAGCGVGAGTGPGDAAHAEAWDVDATAAAATVAVVADGTAAGGAPDAGDYTVGVTTRPVRGVADACDPTGAADRCGAWLTCADPGGGPVCVAAGDCATPIPVAPYGRARATTAAAAAGAHEGSCAATPGHDEAVLVVTTPVVQDILLTTALPATAFDTVLYVRDGSLGGGCGDPGAEVACNDDRAAAARDFRSDVVVYDAQPGVDYYVFVDGSFDDVTGYYTGGLAAAGTFELAARLRPILAAGTAPCDPTGTADRCDWGLSCDPAAPGGPACVLAPDGAECLAAADVSAAVDGAAAMLTTVGGDDNFRGTCAVNAGGVETVVAFTLAAPAASVVISTDNPGTTHPDTVLYVRRPSCAAPVDEIACNDDVDFAGLNFRSEVTLTDAPAGTYYVFVDGWDAFADGDVELSITTM